MPDEELSPEALTLIYLRSKSGRSKKELSLAMGYDEGWIGRFERGLPLSRETLYAIADFLDDPPEAVDALLFVDSLISPLSPEEAASLVALTPEEQKRIDRAALAAGWARAEDVRSRLIQWKKKEKADGALQDAGKLLEILGTYEPQERRELVEVFPEYRSWALAVCACETSIKAAAHKAEEALEWADLAVFISERLSGEEGTSLGVERHCWAYVANSRRVANDHDGADEAFRRAKELLQAGALSDPDLFPEWRLLDLEASLRRDQRRFSEALELLGQARAACGADPSAAGRILLKQEFVLEQMGDIQGALAALAEATPYVEVSQDPHLLFSLRFKEVNSLCHLEHYAEAAERLPLVHKLAVEQGNELDSIRVLWLTSRIVAGLGRALEAVAGLERVRQAFTDRKLPYDAALSSLDLAVLWLKAGRTAEVRELAIDMGWIFKAKRIEREALAALSLFCAAARQEAATVELAQRTRAEIETVRRSASPPDRR